MTLVLAMKAGAGDGVACADRAVTTYKRSGEKERDRNRSRKIVYLGGTCFGGFAGSSGHGGEIFRRLGYALKGSEVSYETFVDKAKETYRAMMADIYEGTVMTRFGASWRLYHSGEMSDRVVRSIDKAIEREQVDQRYFDTDLLLCGIDGNGDFRLTKLVSSGDVEYDQDSDSIGEGDTIANQELEAITSDSPNLRLAGYARAVMEVKRKVAKIVPSVGETVQLVWVTNGGYSEATEQETKMLDAVLACNELRRLKRDEVDHIFEQITSETDDRNRRLDQLLEYLKPRIDPDELYRMFFLRLHHF